MSQDQPAGTAGAPAAAPESPPPIAAPPLVATRETARPTDTAMAAAGIRGSLRDGMRSRIAQQIGTAGEAPPAPPAAPKEESVAPAVKEGQTAAPATQAAAPAPAPKETAASPDPPASAGPPSTPPAAPQEPAAGAPAVPAAETATPTTPAAQEQPAAGRGELPGEYATAEYQQRYAADQGLRTELKRIWNNTSLSEVARVKQMDRRVAAADARLAEVQQAQTRAAQLRRQGDLQGWAAEVERQEAQADAQRQWAQGVTQILARTLGVEPDDEGFLAAGDATPDEPAEVRAQRFAAWAVRNSALGQAALAEAVAAAEAQVRSQADASRGAIETQLTELKTEHDAALKALAKDYEARIAAARAEGLAQGRGVGGFPPRANAAGALTEGGTPPPVPQGLRDIRGDLRAGLSLRREAARAAVPAT